MASASTRVFDDITKLLTNAAGAAQGARREIDTLLKTQVERVLNDLEVVKREEFDAVKAMATKAREENIALKQRIDELEGNAKPALKAASKTPSKAATKKTVKKTTK